MNTDQFSSLLARVFFVGALLLVCAAAFDRVANFFGYTLLWGYTPGRMLEFAVALLIFVIAILLRQVRDQLRQGASS